MGALRLDFAGALLVAGALGAAGCEVVLGLDHPQLYVVTGTGGIGGTTSSGGMGGTTSSVCSPGEMMSCYDGRGGTVGVGICKAGVQTCRADGSGFATCKGQVVPTTEDCLAKGDEDCDGIPCSEPIFVKQFGDSGSQSGYAVAVDPGTGDLIVAGGFQSAMQMGAQLLSSAGSGDVFVARLTPKGDVLWAKGFGDVKEQHATSVAVGPDGTIVFTVANVQGGLVDFGGGPKSDHILIAKLTANGDYKWTRGCGGDPSPFAPSYPLSVAIDQNNDVLVAGGVSGSLDCGNGSVPATYSDAFVVKLSGASGAAAWTQVYGAGAQRATGITVDSLGNALVVGQFSDKINFGNGDLTAVGDADGFIAKLGPSGTAIWSKRFGDGGTTAATDVAVDALGGPLVVGTFDTSVAFGAPSTKLLSNGGTDSFAAKLNAAGGHAWSLRIGDADPTAYVADAFDESGDFVIVGPFDGIVDLGSQELTSEGLDSFVAKLDSTTGEFRWARQAMGAGTTFAADVAVANVSHQIALTGSFTEGMDLGSGEITSVGSGDVFVALLWP
jgi:hypothetical protein